MAKAPVPGTPKKALIVGCGGMGRSWMKNLTANPRVTLVGMVDVRLEAAQSAAKDFGLPAERAFTDLKSAIAACAPDFVVDVTIPEGHCPTTVTALGKGLPVIGEKPLAASMAEAKRMLKASEKAKKLYMVSQSRRYEENHVAVTKTLASGAIGQVTTINCDFYIGAHFGGFRDEMISPLVLDMAIHHFDMCRMFTGSDPVAVYAHEFNPKGSWYKGDVAASIIFEMTKGIVFTYRGSWCAEGHPTAWNGDWRVIGSGGALLFEKDTLPRAQRVQAGSTGFVRPVEDVPVALEPIAAKGIAGSLEEFLDALDKKIKKPQCEVHDNIKSLAMVFAAMKSSRSRKREKVLW
ncbi:MAG: Gfo/Idh/MocA family oxidoreductase [Planctomycetes bacterium]|nr:Gfo/Idh/MocA family oxidoreductase [Planctomycetota bacterium]